MALIVLASASGSPGVTTTALGLALVWPRPVVLVDADPVGGSAVLAGYFQGRAEHNDAMVGLVLAHRDGRLAEGLRSGLMTIPDSQALFLPGVRSHAQAASLSEVWAPLALELRALEGTGQDVIVDVGRLGMVSSPSPLVEQADLALLVVKSDLPSLAAARQWATAWSSASDVGTGAAGVGVVLVGEGRPYTAGELSGVLRIPVVEKITWDERAAQVFSVGQRPTAKFASSALVRSYRALAAAIDVAVSSSRQNPPSADGRDDD